jgi:hypothetical protein
MINEMGLIGDMGCRKLVASPATEIIAAGGFAVASG